MIITVIVGIFMVLESWGQQSMSPHIVFLISSPNVDISLFNYYASYHYQTLKVNREATESLCGVYYIPIDRRLSLRYIVNPVFNVILRNILFCQSNKSVRENLKIISVLVAKVCTVLTSGQSRLKSSVVTRSSGV